MKRLFTFLALCCLVVTGVSAISPTDIKVSDATTTYYYYVKSASNYYWYDDLTSNYLKGTNSSDSKTQFAFYKSGTGGQLYIYSKASGKYLNFTGPDWNNDNSSKDKLSYETTATTRWSIVTGVQSNYVGFRPSDTSSRFINGQAQIGSYSGTGANSSWTIEGEESTTTPQAVIDALYSEEEDASPTDVHATFHNEGTAWTGVTVTTTAKDAAGNDLTDITTTVTGSNNLKINNTDGSKASILIDKNSNAMSNQNVTFTISGLPSGSSFNTVSLPLYAFVAGGANWAPADLGIREINVGVAVKQGENVLYNGSLTDFNIGSKCGEGIANDNLKFDMGTVTTNGTTPLTVEFTINTGTSNGGCFIALQSLNLTSTKIEPVTATYTLNPAAGTVEASDLAKVTITFTGDDVEGMDFSEDVHPTLTKEGETAISGTIEMNEEVGEPGIFDITFNTTDMASGEWTLSIPQGAFSVMKEINSEIVDVPVAEITATYNVASAASDASLEMLETAGTYYVYIKDGGKYLHNNDNGAVTATESAERAQSEIERSNAHIWRLVSDGENVTITNGYGNGYNSATPNTITLADVPTTWHLDNIVESKIWNADVRYAEEGCIYYGTMAAYNGGFFATAKSVTTIYPTAGPVEDMYAGTIHNDEDPDSPTLTLRYYTEEERLEMPYLVQLTNRIINAMFNESVGYAPLSDDDLENMDPEIAELIITFSIVDPEVAADEAEPEYYRETLAALNMLAENNKNNIIMPQAGQAYHLVVRSTDAHDCWYLKNDGGLSTNAADAAVFVMGSTSNTEGYGTLFASNDQTNSKYLQPGGAMSAQYAENSCDFEVMPMVLQSNSHITADMGHRFGTFSLVAKGRASGYVNMKGALVVDETKGSWGIADEPFMNGKNTSAIEMETVDYPYTKPNLVSGTGDGHTGVWASVWLPFPMNIPDGIEVYKGTQERTVKGEPYLGLTKVDPDTHSCYAAGGYLLYSTTVSAGTIDVLPANSVPTDARETDDAAFVGSTENPGVADDGDEWTAFSANFNGATPYVLANKSNGVGFYKYVGTKMPKGKAIWLKPADSSDAECVKLGFDDIISAIEALHGHTEGVEIFDLQGRRLDKVQKGQVNVINGQKIMFK